MPANLTCKIEGLLEEPSSCVNREVGTNVKIHYNRKNAMKMLWNRAQHVPSMRRSVIYLLTNGVDDVS